MRQCEDPDCEYANVHDEVHSLDLTSSSPIVLTGIKASFTEFLKSQLLELWVDDPEKVRSLSPETLVSLA
jgi:hypothetical protein